MVLLVMPRSFVTRLLAALFVALIVSPYTEPLAAIHAPGAGHAGVFDLDDAGKSKTSIQDGLAALSSIAAVPLLVTAPERPLALFVTLDPRHGRRTTLRL